MADILKRRPTVSKIKLNIWRKKMTFGLVFGFLFALIIAVGVLIIVRKMHRTRTRKINPIGVVLAAVGIMGILLIPSSFHTVEAGEIAVVKHLGEAKKVRKAGTYFDFWLTEKGIHEILYIYLLQILALHFFAK